MAGCKHTQEFGETPLPSQISLTQVLADGVKGRHGRRGLREGFCCCCWVFLLNFQKVVSKITAIHRTKEERHKK
jgi:hypothetical protein